MTVVVGVAVGGAVPVGELEHAVSTLEAELTSKLRQQLVAAIADAACPAGGEIRLDDAQAILLLALMSPRPAVDRFPRLRQALRTGLSLAN